MSIIIILIVAMAAAIGYLRSLRITYDFKPNVAIRPTAANPKELQKDILMAFI
jgi:hypothetical protein